MLQEVAAVDGVVEVLRLVIALLARQLVDAVDAALSAYAVRSLDGREAHHVDVDAPFSQLHRRGQSGQSAADYQYALLCHVRLLSILSHPAQRGCVA
jgi:hypothetical protein